MLTGSFPGLCGSFCLRLASIFNHRPQNHRSGLLYPDKAEFTRIGHAFSKTEKRAEPCSQIKAARNRGDRIDISSPFQIFSLYQKNRQIIHPLDFCLSSMKKLVPKGGRKTWSGIKPCLCPLFFQNTVLWKNLWRLRS